jgi:Flp pilus assembly pilin Flp
MIRAYLRFRNWIGRFLPGQGGQTLSEYGPILVLIAILVIMVLGVLGGQVSALFSRVTSEFGGVS